MQRQLCQTAVANPLAHSRVLKGIEPVEAGVMWGGTVKEKGEGSESKRGNFKKTHRQLISGLSESELG